MWTADACRKKADEAEQLAGVVALGTDRERLQAEARSWRQQAAETDARERAWSEPQPPSALQHLASFFGARRR